MGYIWSPPGKYVWTIRAWRWGGLSLSLLQQLVYSLQGFDIGVDPSQTVRANRVTKFFPFLSLVLSYLLSFPPLLSPSPPPSAPWNPTTVWRMLQVPEAPTNSAQTYRLQILKPNPKYYWFFFNSQYNSREDVPLRVKVWDGQENWYLHGIDAYNPGAQLAMWDSKVCTITGGVPLEGAIFLHDFMCNWKYKYILYVTKDNLDIKYSQYRDQQFDYYSYGHRWARLQRCNQAEKLDCMSIPSFSTFISSRSPLLSSFASSLFHRRSFCIHSPVN